jgi:hypothetical protein
VVSHNASHHNEHGNPTPPNHAPYVTTKQRKDTEKWSIGDIPVVPDVPRRAMELQTDHDFSGTSVWNPDAAHLMAIGAVTSHSQAVPK